MTGFDLKSQGITVKDIRRNLAPPILYEEAIRIEPDSAHRRLGRPGRLLRGEDRPLAEGQARRPAAAVGGATSGGATVNIPLDAASLRHQPRAGQGLPQHPRRGCTVSTASPAGTRSTGSRSASSARGRTTPCSCTTC